MDKGTPTRIGCTIVGTTKSLTTGEIEPATISMRVLFPRDSSRRRLGSVVEVLARVYRRAKLTVAYMRTRDTRCILQAIVRVATINIGRGSGRRVGG